MSGWWLLLQIIPTGILIIFWRIAVEDDVMSATRIGLMSYLPFVLTPVLVIYIWFFIQLFCLRGTLGINNYGSD
jgi:uncharacterized membrane protein YhaH (DUF805 family)